MGKRGILFLFLLLLFNLCFVSATTINGNIQRVEQDGTSLFEGISVEIKLSDNSTYETSSDKEGNFLFNINKPEESLSQIKLLYNGCLLFESNPSASLDEEINFIFTINSLNNCQESNLKTLRSISTSSLSSQANQYPNSMIYYISPLSSSKNPVLLIHGWGNDDDSDSKNWGNLEKELYDTNEYQVWKLQYYPGNLSNKKNAGVISSAIDTVLYYHPSFTKIDIISHSMGGLGTRGYIQNLAVGREGNYIYYRNNIRKYIIIASPMYGSYFANMVDGIDKYDLLSKHPRCQNLVDKEELNGGTEATLDMEIGSDFTWELNKQDLNKNVQYLTISGSELAPFIINRYVESRYCLSNTWEVNDGVVSLTSSNLIKDNVVSILINKFHKSIYFPDTNIIIYNGIDTYQNTAEICVLFLEGSLNSYTAGQNLNSNLAEFYYDPKSSVMPSQLNNGEIIIQLKNSEVGINEDSLVLRGVSSSLSYPLERNPNTGRWFYSSVSSLPDEYLLFTNQIPPQDYYVRVNGYNSGQVVLVTKGQVTLADINLDKDNDGYDQTSIGGTDCNDNNNAIHPRAIEKCNNIDDNCNGFIDEGFDKGVLCSAGIGECKVDGVKVCSGDGSTTVCNAVPKSPIEEICFDGLDNDCDGEIDEECNSCVLLFTSMGNITLELYEDMPLTTLNFKILTSDKFYDNTIFHRVIEDFMIQGGDPTGTGMGGPGYVILDEFTHAGGNKNNRGTISMANAGPNTGGSQFFINLVDNNYLDEKNPVFGEVVKGMEVVDAISTVEVNEYDKPINDVIIIKASLTKCCIPNFVNSSWSSWSNISCLSNNKMNQSRFKIQYDFNFCGKFENKTFYEYRNTQNCKYNTCTPQLTNTTWNSWKNESCLTNINKMNQSRYLTQYDSNFCRINLSDVYVGFVPSDLASRVSLDQTEDEYKFEIDYYGEEITADVYVLGGGGESFKLDKSTNHINFNEGLNSIYNSLDDSEMPLFLASGIYLGEEYIQEITLSDNVLTLFADKDYKDQEPAIGFKWNNGENILSYEIEFDNTIPFNSLIGTYLPLMDNKYYVQSANSSQIRLSMPGMNISIKNNEEIELNGTDIDGLYATFTNYGIKLFWNSNGDTFLTQENSITIPLFETISLVFENFNFPEYSERISLEDGETMMLNMDNYELPILWFDGVSAFLGEEGYPLITKTSVLTSKYYSGSQNTTPLTGGLDLREDDRFLITSLDNDLSDIETLYYEVVYILWDGEEILVELNDLIGSNDLTFDDLNDEKDVGDITLSLAQVNNTNVYLKFNSISGTISYNNVISDKGMKITLPEKTDTQPNDVETGVKITFQEANKEGDVGEGKSFTATIKSNINDKLHVTNTNVTLLEILSNRLIISNKTFYEYRQVQNCTDYTCISQLKNTSWSNWQNISCVSNNKMNQSRFRIQYDFNFCGKVENKTFYEYQSIKNCNDLVVISPDKEIYSKTSILFNINSTKPNYKLSKLVYSDNGKTPVTLCSNCYGYSRARTLTNGYHDILFKGITPEGDTITNSVQLLIDSKLPVISSVKPTSSKYTNGSDFYVKYSEDNCKELILMINEGDIRSGSCDSGKYIEKYLSEDLSKHDGEIVSYKFKIIDIADNVKESRSTKIKVDTTAPEIKDLKIEKSGRYAVFNMTILNEDKYSFNKVEYIDNSALKPTWKSLCTSLSYGKYCYKKIYFQSGNHDITVRVSDDAGNSDKENKIVKI